ncbi:tRNA pseudouridine(55) synthase TruB [Synechococcus sp. RSCCF101]|nr:tRNA pseudouridine(55) synthase TruB [Synechococcus sp. RSCCF101]
MPCGFLVLDKPAGLTSHDCVSRVRRAYGLRRVGHGGTLDPAVTGVLPIAVGAATRFLPYLRQDKRYRGRIQLGLRTDTDDLEGAVLERQPPPDLSRDELETALERFRGVIQQVPPQVSAVRVDGVRAYRLARQGQTAVLQARSQTVHSLELERWDAASGELELSVVCSAGTYIRALARDLGQLLGCGGCLAELRRTGALGFEESEAVPLARLSEPPPPDLLDPLQALRHWRWHRLDHEAMTAWQCGRRLRAAEPDEPGPVVVLGPEGDLAGMAHPDGEWLQPKLVLNARG